MISAVVLAAGRAETSSKLLAPLRGKPVLRRVLEAVAASRVDEVLCVVRDAAQCQENISMGGDRLLWLVDDNAGMGQSNVLIAGLWAVDPGTAGVLFISGEQAFLGRDLVDALLDRFERNPTAIVAPSFQGQMRNPVLFPRELFRELLEVKSDGIGREVIERNRDRVALVPWHEEAPFLDLDHEENDERLFLLV